MTTLTQSKHDQIATVYTQMFRQGKSTLPVWDEQWGFVRRHLPTDRNAKILDAGCGNGKYTRAIVQAGYRDTLALDLFETGEAAGIEPTRYVCASVAATPFDDASFDCVCSLSVIFYLDDPSDALREFYRLLTPGGKVIVSCHSRYSIFTLVRVIKRWLKVRSASHLRHVKFLPALEYKKMLEAAGFDVEEVDGFRASYVLTQARRLLRRLGIAGRSSSMDKPRPRWLGMLRALVGYHAMLVAVKPGVAPATIRRCA